MRKKLNIIVGIMIIFVIVIFSIYITDKIRMNNNLKPIFCIETTNSENEIVYIGIGYKVIKYKSNYDSSEVYKIGTWSLECDSPYNNATEMETPLPVVYSYFSDTNEGIAIGVGDQAMETYALQVYNTADGGKTWELKTGVEGTFISVNIDAKYLFINSEIGFIFNPSRNEICADLLMTTDGGKTFEVIKFVDNEFININEGLQISKDEVYDFYELPIYEYGVLTVIVSQGVDGDFNSGKTVLEYISTDMGNTWEFVKEYER